MSLPEISARIRRLQGEWSYKGAYQLCEEFLLACMQEGLSDDHIVILAREHKPTQERFKPNEDCPSTFESRIDATLATLRLEHPLSVDAPSYIDWNSLGEAVTATNWCIDNWIERGDHVSLVGPAKVGKSLLALDAAASKVIGGSFLGTDLAAGRVLYLDYENKLDVVCERLFAMGFDLTDLSGLSYECFPQTGPLDCAPGAQAVLKRVEETGAELVVIDTLQRVLTGDENNSQGVRDMYRLLSMPLRARNVAVLRLDHLGKSDRTSARGTSAKGDDVDQSWVLTQRADDLLTLRKALGRTPAPIERFVLKRTSSPLGHEVVSNAPDEPFDEDSTDDLDQVVARLDELSLPNRAGRPAAIKKLKEAGQSYTTATLSAAVKIRQERGL